MRYGFSGMVCVAAKAVCFEPLKTQNPEDTRCVIAGG